MAYNPAISFRCDAEIRSINRVFWIVPTLYSKQSHDFFIVSSAAGHPSFHSFWTRLPEQSSARARRRVRPAKRHEHAVRTRTLEDWLSFEPWRDTLSL